jgi:hypothetical protein
MFKIRSCFALSVLLFFAIAAFTQTPNLEPQQADNPAIPTVTYTFDWPSIQPHHYSIAVDSTGRAAYESITAEGTATQSVDGDPYQVKFTVSEPTRSRIFEIAKQLNYFNGDFDFKRHKIAFSGTKTLAFAEGNKKFQTSFNWSENPAIQQLTELFTGIANTEEAGRRLEHLRRFDKLGLNQELARMEDLSKNRGLAEVQSITPILQQLASDPAVMNIARERAQRLLRLAQRQATGGQ